MFLRASAPTSILRMLDAVRGGPCLATMSIRLQAQDYVGQILLDRLSRA